MSTIRPLATIAILAGLGVFLAQQINEPKDDAQQLTANWGEAPAFESGAATSAPPAFQANSMAPPLSGPPLEAPSIEAPAIAPPAPAATASNGSGLPPLPALPNETGPPIAAPTTPSMPTPPAANDFSKDIPMPDEVAEADYNGAPTDNLPADLLGGPPPSAASEAPRYGAPPTGESTLPAGDPYQSYSPPAQDKPAAPTTPGNSDSYATLGQVPGAAAPTFRDSLPAINQALDRNELTRAHALLSSWYGDPGLSPVEREKVEELLGQLAGTVVYSTDHRLEPAYTVKLGDTLTSIAEEHQVPWRLLAKINGVPDADSIQVGQTLKVLRGPFGAVVDTANSELVLMIDGKYAGKFPVQLSGAAQQEGAWRVVQKPDGSPNAYGPPTGKQLVLSDSSGMATLVIGAGGGSPMERGRVSVAASDLDELHDILSVGSEVTIRR